MKRFGLFTAMALCILVLFVVRVQLFLEHERANDLSVWTGEKVIVEGVVINDPENRETSLHIIVEVLAINGTQERGRLLIILSRSTELTYNDNITVAGKITAPESFVTNTGREFNYPGYLRVRGVSGLIRYAEIKNTKAGDFTIYGLLYNIKHKFERSIERILPEPQASLFEGILLGERRGLPDALTSAFIVASLIHIVVLSGYNISIIGEAVLRSMTFLQRKTSFIIGGILMILFVLMTGAGSTSIRAGIMALIAILARYLHRPAVALRSLAVAATAMLFWNPLVVLYDASFMLSIIATFGLITLGNAVELRINKVPAWKYFNMRSIVASTIAVQIFILPALLYFSGVLSFVALPANVLVLPLVSLTMLTGFVSGLLGLFSSTIAFLPALITDMLLRYMIFVANVSASLPFSSVIIPAFPAWIALLVYIPLSSFAIFVYQRNVFRTQTS